jgi:glutamate-1-semialdehyde 2,1-aminomutase
MRRVAPAGDVYQAGTLSGNPLAVAAGLATLEALEADGVYEQLADSAAAIADGLEVIAREVGIELCTSSVGGMFGFYFHPGPVRNFDDAKKAHGQRFERFFTSMLEQGIYLAPSAFEAGFVSLAHRKRDIARTLDAARVALGRAARIR